ncbi:MAG: phenylalanine--tRNA ligase subunit alpha [Ignavibacteriae bacterium]|nr:phenylalanine--tRNA ligase subunit alpha [Ignavibacteria bacterium]MBI3365498.1 phenylalanine--tRNA ligase subunit alpha [Ignavibacteriota bacterium]
MIDQIEQIRRAAATEIEAASDLQALDITRVKYLARKGAIANLFDNLKTISATDRPAMGKALNELRQSVQSLFDQKKASLDLAAMPQQTSYDLTLPGRMRWIGSKHPITQTIDEIKRIFIGMGFQVATGPEIEDDYHNFEALNFPPDHPARDMQDTFFITDKILLRTHTSPVQIRVMENQKPPVRVIIPGRVYRNEAISARSYCLFHQVEGLYVDKGVTFSELKGTLLTFARQFYGSSIKYRFRPSFFPFTEPSAEMDITCYLCSGKGCRVCKQTGWLEILGCGMVHPNVFKNVNYDPEEVTGYAFGMGIERITMLRYGVDDIRTLFENDTRFLKQFR